MIKYLFPKTSRLLKSREFRLCAKYGTNKAGSILHIHIRKTVSSPYSQVKLGLTVSRRFGKAVIRNRFKRLVREVFRLHQHEIPKNIHINVRPGPEASSATFQKIKDEFKKLLT